MIYKLQIVVFIYYYLKQIYISQTHELVYILGAIFSPQNLIFLYISSFFSRTERPYPGYYFLIFKGYYFFY